MTTVQVNLTGLYSDLNKLIKVADYKQALKAANKILHTKEGKEDVDAMHCRVVCMLQMNQFAEALKFIESTELIKEELPFEKAYCQYRLLKSEEALETINNVKDLDIGLLELKAQVLYKLGHYKDALGIYKRLIKDCSDDNDEERMTNVTAVHAALSSFSNVETEIGFEAESYEQLYNRACWLLGRNRVEEAQDTLEQAESACRDLFSDDPDMAPEEIEAEISLIRVQIGYALQLQGKNDEALEIYHQVIRSRPTDLGMVAVASNNIISINKEQNMFESRKKVKATIASGVESKLVPFQKRIIDFNRALLFLYSNQWDSCKKLLKCLHREYRSSDIPCLIEAAQLCREKNRNKAIDYMQTFIDEHSYPDIAPEIDLTNIKLALVQLLLAQGKLTQSCKILEGMHNICYTPGVVSCLVSLYNTQSDAGESASKLLQRAIDWHRKSKSAGGILIDLMWQSSKLHLQNNNPQDAADVLEAILRLDPQNVKVLATLIRAYSQYDTQKAHRASQDLPSLTELALDVDVNELEQNASRLTPRYIKKQKEKVETVSVVKKNENNLVSEGSVALIVKKSKKKKKKNPIPKNLEPNRDPDPERWIPLRERSYFKGRRKDKKKVTVGKGTQGSHRGASDNYDMSQTAASAAPNSPKPEPISGSQVQAGSKEKRSANRRRKKGR